MAKNLIRYTIGHIHRDHFVEIFYQAIKNTKKLCPDFDVVILYNGLRKRHFNKIKSWGVPMIDQLDYIGSLKYPPPVTERNVCWKLYPPRLRLDAFEVTIDSDIVLLKRPPQLDLFVQDPQSVLLYYALERNYGRYANLIPPGVRINSGIYGLPPHFDFTSKLNKKMIGSNWTHKYDEQGLVASILSKHRYYAIPQMSIPILKNKWGDFYLKNAEQPYYGFHFQCNREEWRRYEDCFFSRSKITLI